MTTIPFPKSWPTKPGPTRWMTPSTRRKMVLEFVRARRQQRRFDWDQELRSAATELTSVNDNGDLSVPGGRHGRPLGD